MATRYSPKIVTDGLVLCLDAGNVKSYPRSGNAWNDISKNGNNGTLQNTPAFSSANGGSIVFDGVDDYVDFGNSLSSMFPSQEITIASYGKLSGVVSKNTLVSFNGSYNFFMPGNRFTTTNQLYWDSVSGWKIGNKTDWDLTKWYYFAWSISSTTLKMYVNGILDLNTSISTNFSPSGQTRIGFANAGEYAYGNIGQIQMYNRSLKDIEIVQNYNAIRKRFGL